MKIMKQKIKLIGILLAFTVLSACKEQTKETTSASNNTSKKVTEETHSELKIKPNGIINGVKQVWIDADLAVGKKNIGKPGYSDVDDGYAVLQLLQADNVKINGLSTVFGNNSVENAFAIGNYISKEFAAQKIKVYKGAGSAINLDSVVTNDAVEAMATALKKQPLTILAIGPATNVGLLLLKYPELKSQIVEVVLVAGRRTANDYFKIGNKGVQAQDLNFDLDNTAFRVLLENKVSLVFCPYEISSKVWLKQEDLEAFKTTTPGMKWLATASQPWLEQWKNQGADGFNPFDVMASHYIIAPEDIVSEPLLARLEINLDDTVKENNKETYKSYLLCTKEEGAPVTYCYDVVPGFHQKLMSTFKAN